MKLLVITQSVDQNNPVLGFFHRWIEEFSKHYELVTVICLEQGKFNLPENVKVLSLGKETGKSKLKYIKNFYKYLWQERKNHDAVFVHMNQEYVLLGAGFWKLWGKKVTMWRNHHAGNWLTTLAVFLSDKVFCPSRYSYTAKYKNAVLMPVGIDLDLFKIDKNISRRANAILFLSRMAPSKRPHLLIEALAKLRDEGVDSSASFYGDPTPADEDYYELLKKLVEKLDLSNQVAFKSGVPNIETVAIYNQHEICVNLSSSGMYDKTIFEAATCGALSLSANRNLVGEFDEQLLFTENSIDDLAAKLKNLLALSGGEKEKLRVETSNYVAEKHSLAVLATRLVSEVNNTRAKYVKLLRYLISGSTAAAVDIIFLALFTSVFHIWYLFSAILAFLIAFVVSFVLQKFWTFSDRSTDRLKSQMAAYFLITATNLGVNTLLMYLFVDYGHLHYILAQIVTSALVACEGFFVYQIFVFRPAK